MWQLFEIIAWILGEHWKLSNVEAVRLASAIIDVETSIPRPFIMAAARFMAPLTLTVAIGMVLRPRLQKQREIWLAKRRATAADQQEARDRRIAPGGVQRVEAPRDIPHEAPLEPQQRPASYAADEMLDGVGYDATAADLPPTFGVGRNGEIVYVTPPV